MVLIAKFYFQYTSASDASSDEDSSADADADADADSEENHDAEQPAEPQAVHKETITVPTTTSTTTPMRSTPVEQWVGDMASEPRTPSRKSRRLATVGLTPVKKSAPATTTTTTPVTVSAPAAAEEISPLKQDGQLDGPNTPRKEPKPTPTPESAVASTSGVGVAKKKKRGRPKKTPKAPKSTEVTPQKSDTSTVEGGKEPSKPEQTTPTTTTAPSADAPVDQDTNVNESSLPIPPSDMNISKVGQASAAQIEIAALASAAVAASESVASTSAASALARTPTKTKTPVKRKAAERYANIYTDSEDEANRETQSKTGRLTFTPKKTPLVNLTPEKKSKQKKKKPKPKSKKSDASDTDSYRREVEERRTKAIEDMAKSFSDLLAKSPVMPTPTPAAVIVAELDDDKLWAKLLVRRIKQIKDEDMREDFKQHVNVIALQAVRGTWQVSPANFPSPLLSMGRPGFLNSPAKHTKFPLPPASSQTRSAQGASGDFSGWSNVGRQARVGQLGQQMPASANMQQMPASANMQQMPASANMQQMPASGNMGNMGMPIGSMHTMTQEEWDSRMAFQGMMPSMGMQ